MSVGGVAGSDVRILSWYFAWYHGFHKFDPYKCAGGRGPDGLRYVNDDRKDGVVEVESTRGGEIDLCGLKPISLMLRYEKMVRGGPGFLAPPRAVMGIWVERGKGIHQSTCVK